MESQYKTPRWVKGLGIAALLLVIIVAIMMLSGHNPAQHMHLSQAESTEVSGQ